MYILITNKSNQHEIMHVQVIPRVGDKIDKFRMHMKPMPIVKQVILFPSDSTVEQSFERLGLHGSNTFNIVAIVDIE